MDEKDKILEPEDVEAKSGKFIVNVESATRTFGTLSPYRLLKALLCCCCLLAWGVYQWQWIRIDVLVPWRTSGSERVIDSQMEKGVWMNEVASLMTEMYELLIEMKYLKKEALIYPPHVQPAINVTLAKYIGLEDDAIKMLQILPYTSPTPSPYYHFSSKPRNLSVHFLPDTYVDQFVLGNQMVDMRDDDMFLYSRAIWQNGLDLWMARHFNRPMPVYDNLGHPLLRPWQISLAGTWGTRGNARQNFVVLDLRTRDIYTIAWAINNLTKIGDDAFIWQGSVDPVTRGRFAKGKDHYYNRTDDRLFQLETYASRPATEVLRDYIDRFRRLYWVPGHDSDNDHIAYSRDSYRSLYEKAGWPTQFDGKAFTRARLEFDKRQVERCEVTKPAEALDWAKFWAEWSKNNTQTKETQLSELRALDPTVETEDWDPRLKEYKGNSERRILDDIESSQRSVKKYEDSIPQLELEEKKVPDWARSERNDILKKYGKADQSGCRWERIDFDAFLD